jgi:VanZ family protein
MSSSAVSAQNTGGVLEPLLAWLGLGPAAIDLLHFLARKAAHVTEYGILALLWRRAFILGGPARPLVASVLALAISMTCAVVDETRQSFVATRTGSAADVGLDAFGALAAIAAAQVGWWRTLHALTGLLLWVAVVGGGAALAVTLAWGSGGGLLWLTIPAAAALLVYRHRRAPSDN